MSVVRRCLLRGVIKFVLAESLLACPLYRGCPHFRESFQRGFTVFQTLSFFLSVCLLMLTITLATVAKLIMKLVLW